MNAPTLSNCQQKVTDTFSSFLLDDEPILVIEGPPGTGKTWVTKHLINIARKQAGIIKLITNSDNEINIKLTATTNKAAEVLKDKIGEETETIHKLLGLKVNSNFKTGVVSLQKTGNSKAIHNNLIFIDECSMMNTRLLDIVKELTVDCKVVFILDPYQLAPVKESSCPVTHLTNKVTMSEIQRQKGIGKKDHPIAALGLLFRAAVDTGVFPKIIPNGTSILHEEGSVFQQMVEDEFMKELGVDHCRILAWSNARVNEYNSHIRSLFTPEPCYQVGEMIVTNKPILQGGMTVAPTDHVMKVTQISGLTTSQDIEGWYIDLGGIRVFQPCEQYKVKQLMKQFSNQKDWVSYFEAKEYFADLRPVHASTVHKSQGSTYHTAFIDLGDIGRCNCPMDVARMLNVATTRATTRVVFYGELPPKYSGLPISEEDAEFEASFNTKPNYGNHGGG